jgi:radical SAM superfamily enzyme YgiQ (UPF0313 family)
MKIENDNFRDWVDKNYHRLTGYGQWLRGEALNTIPAEAFEQRPFRILIARLSAYFDTVDSWTHKLLYSLAVEDADTFADLAYLPPQMDLKIFETDGIPLWLGTKTKRGPQQFQLLAISNSCVQELINLPALLARSGIPLFKSERMERPDVPLVVLGGANAMNTSAFWTDDPPLDGVFVGEDAGCVERIFRICREALLNRTSKSLILERLETVDGFFQPDKIKPTRIAHRVPLAGNGIPDRAPVLFGESQPGCAPIPISEGCPCFCGFCSESWVRRPYREMPFETLIEKMDALKADMGLSQIEFSSFNFNMHSRFFDLLWHAVGRFDRVRLKSQRFDPLADDPALMSILYATGKTSVTCGLEGISSRLRRYLNKHLDDHKIFKSLSALHQVPLRELKIFLIATRLEAAEDYGEFDGLLDALRKIQMDERRFPRTIFSITPLIRFPWTPLEYEDAPSLENVSAVVREIENRVRVHGFEFRESSPPHEYWVSQILARADDPRIFRALVKTSMESRNFYYKNIPERFSTVFRNRLAKTGLVPDMLLRGTPPSESREKPWRKIRTGVKLEFLIRQYGKNRTFEEVPSCLGTNASPGTCPGCGVCLDAPSQRILVRIAQKRNFSAAQFTDRVRTTHESVREIGLLVRAGERNRGIPRNLLAAAAAVSLMSDEKKLVPFYFGFKSSFWDGRENPPWVWGDDILILRWLKPGIRILTEILRDAKSMEGINRKMNGWGKILGTAAEPAEGFDLKIKSPYAFNLSNYFNECGISGTMRKIEEGGYRYDFSKESLRKKILFGLTLPNKESDQWTVELSVGPKFLVETFLKNAFVLPDPKAWVRISAEASFLKS